MTSCTGATVAAPTAMRLLFLLGVLCASACAFEVDVPTEEDPGDEPMEPNPMPPAQRCTGNGMELCIDFEGDPLISDAFGASTQASNVMSTTRDVEKAAHWMGMSWMYVENTPRLDHADAYTIEMWTKPMRLPPKMGDQQVGLFEAKYQYEMNLEWDGAIECRFYDVTHTNDDNADSEIRIGTGTWHHVACTYDRSELRVYVDGKLTGCRSSTKAVSTIDTAGAAIGANLNYGPMFVNRFDGDLDNVHLYNRALSATEICEAWGYDDCSATCPDD